MVLQEPEFGWAASWASLSPDSLCEPGAGLCTSRRPRVPFVTCMGQAAAEVLSFLAVLWLNELLLLSSLPLTPTGGSMGDLFLSSSLETWHCLCQEGCSLPGSGGRARLGTGRGHLSWSQALLWVQLCFRSLAWAGAGPLTSIWTCCLLTFGWSFAKVSPACIA